MTRMSTKPDPLTTIMRRVALSIESKGVEHVEFYDAHKSAIDQAIRDSYHAGRAAVRAPILEALGLRYGSW